MSKELDEAIANYKEYHKYLTSVKFNEVEYTKLISACMQASSAAYIGEGDIRAGKEVSALGKVLLEEMIFGVTNGTFNQLEEWTQENHTEVELINQYYDFLRYEAPYLVDSYKLYVERKRPKRERFYEPRRRTLKRISNAVQRLEDDELDVLFLHCPPRVGKSGDLTLDIAWHISKDMETSNLYVTYKEGLGGAFLDGVCEIFNDPTYCHSEIFPQSAIVDTDAKNHKIDLGRKKKYKSLSGKGLEAGLNGEYDAKGWLIIDDPLEGVQDVLNPEVLKRKQTIFDNNVLSRAKEKCKIILMGTIWSLNDLFMNYLHFVETHPVRYDVIKIPALNENDESNFNYDYGVGFSTEYYQRKRSKHEMNDDMAGWYAQYQQEPIERDGAVFTPEHMAEYYDALPAIEPLKIIAHCDVALGGGDFLSFPIVYCYEDGEMYCEDVVFDNSEKHITQPQVLSKITQHEIKNAHFESNQGGEGYKDDIVRMLKENKYECKVSSDWAPVTKRKEQRIWDAAERIRQIHFKKPECRSKQYQKFMQNLFSFTMVHSKRKHDDAADSLAGLIAFDEKGSGVATVQAIKNPFRS